MSLSLGLSNNSSGFRTDFDTVSLSLEGGETSGIFVSRNALYVVLRFRATFSRPTLSATSVILSITGSAPFNGTQDQNISVAYVSVFILAFCVSSSVQSIRIQASA